MTHPGFKTGEATGKGSACSFLGKYALCLYGGVRATGHTTTNNRSLLAGLASVLRMPTERHDPRLRGDSKASRNNYERDKESGTLALDRRLFAAVTYPTDYGFIPETIAGDGDELDAMVAVTEPTFPGCSSPAKRPAEDARWQEPQRQGAHSAGLGSLLERS